MSYEDAEYLERRAEEEIELAQQAQHNKAVQAHYDLASAYLERIHGDSPKRPPGLFGV